MAVLVLDASAFVELVLRSDAGREVEDHLRGATVAVPAHFDAEAFSALGRLVRAEEVAEERMEAAIGLLATAPFTRYAVAPLLQASWALRHDLWLRDALYVTLAQQLEATLLTADSRLAAAPGLEVALVVMGDSG